jgi:hypothetical protein
LGTSWDQLQDKPLAFTTLPQGLFLEEAKVSLGEPADANLCSSHIQIGFI